VVSSGTSFFTSSGTSSKWVYNAAGVLVNIPAGTLALDYDPVTHAARGLLCEPQATNFLLNNASLSTQSVTVTATPYTLSFTGAGTLTLSGASTAGPLVGVDPSTRVSLTFTPTAGTLTLTVAGSVNRAQLESGSVATSFVPTLGATVTRAADNVKALAASIGYSATAGSWWAEVYILSRDSDDNIVGSNLAARPIFYNSGAYEMFEGALLYVLVGSVYNSVQKVISAFTSGSRAITANGLAVSADAGTTMGLLAPADVYFGSGNGTNMHGCIRKLRYLPRRPTNVEMQSMTA
jgi:hypothetical protein